MSEMIERVAKALYDETCSGKYGKLAYGDPPIPWEHVGEGIRSMYRPKARAAIAAMREPTPEMERVGTNERHESGAAPLIWREMIDEALK